MNSERVKNSRKPSHKLLKLERIPPTAPAARDEGPRLIPLEDPMSEPSRLEHYLDLADAALGLRRENQNTERRPIEPNNR